LESNQKTNCHCQGSESTITRETWKCDGVASHMWTSSCLLSYGTLGKLVSCSTKECAGNKITGTDHKCNDADGKDEQGGGPLPLENQQAWKEKDH